MRANHFLQDRPRAGERSDSTLANGLSGAHCQAMGYVLLKIVDFLIAICVAWVVAVTVWYVAHYVFGAFGLDVRNVSPDGRGHFRPASGDRVVRKEIQMTPLSP